MSSKKNQARSFGKAEAEKNTAVVIDPEKEFETLTKGRKSRTLESCEGYPVLHVGGMSKCSALFGVGKKHF